MPDPSAEIPRAKTPANPAYERVTILWMVLMGIVGFAVWIWMFGGTGDSGIVTSAVPRTEVDDAASVIARFGAPEIDRLDGPDGEDAPNTTRTLTYTSRRL